MLEREREHIPIQLCALPLDAIIFVKRIIDQNDTTRTQRLVCRVHVSISRV